MNTLPQEKSKTLWLNGHFLPVASATIPIGTHALHYASSVFEGIRSYNGHVFKMHEHYERFNQSAQSLGFKLPYDTAKLEQATRELLQREDFPYTYIRPLAWCGTRKITVASRGADVNVAIMAWERPLNRECEGIRLVESRWRRPDPRTAPVHSKAAGLYMISTMSKNEADAQGYDDALLLDYRGNVAEASTANIFIVKDSKLVTPTPHSFLNGITRLTIIDLARRLGISVEERDVVLEDFEGATEAFLTGTVIEILSIREIHSSRGIFAFNPKSGSITDRLKQAFYQLTTSVLDKTK